MPRGTYTRKLTDEEIIRLVDEGKYRVDLDEGEVYGKFGKLYTFRGNVNVRKGRQEGIGTPWTRLYSQPGHRAITVARVVWIIGNRRVVPDGFEIHHYDVDENNNRFDNLYAISEIDHDKLHKLLNSTKGETPF